MKVVALISGGKDSCYNMMHCVANGHTIEALANLYPVQGDEIDSWMYQTVGHDVIDLYQDAMGVPLYRRPILGKNVQQNLGYEQVSGDETEDMYNLLQDVLKSHPDIDAISVGAIASNYQRLRVENVASRLGLTVLAFLWERDQVELLNEMSTQLEAILIKVACEGLSDRHLGKTLSEMQPTLMKLHERFGVHPCGEGGEYESIVLDCPLFKRRLVLESKEVVKQEGDTAYLRLKAGLDSKLPQTVKVWQPWLISG
jgi:diphthine-ammonia ligase